MSLYISFTKFNFQITTCVVLNFKKKLLNKRKKIDSTKIKRTLLPNQSVRPPLMIYAPRSWLYVRIILPGLERTQPCQVRRENALILFQNIQINLL